MFVLLEYFVYYYWTLYVPFPNLSSFKCLPSYYYFCVQDQQYSKNKNKNLSRKNKIHIFSLINDFSILICIFAS